MSESEFGKLMYQAGKMILDDEISSLPENLRDGSPERLPEKYLLRLRRLRRIAFTAAIISALTFFAAIGAAAKDIAFSRVRRDDGNYGVSVSGGAERHSAFLSRQRLPSYIPDGWQIETRLTRDEYCAFIYLSDENHKYGDIITISQRVYDPDFRVVTDGHLDVCETIEVKKGVYGTLYTRSDGIKGYLLFYVDDYIFIAAADDIDRDLFLDVAGSIE